MRTGVGIERAPASVRLAGLNRAPCVSAPQHVCHAIDSGAATDFEGKRVDHALGPRPQGAVGCLQMSTRLRKIVDHSTTSAGNPCRRRRVSQARPLPERGGGPRGGHIELRSAVGRDRVGALYARADLNVSPEASPRLRSIQNVSLMVRGCS